MAMKKDEIGARLRSERERVGLSRDQVVDHISYSRSTLQQWEAGSTEPPISAIGQLANLYKVSPQYLIFGTDESTIPVPTTNKNDEYAYIPAYDMVASAGLGEKCQPLLNTKKKLAFRKDWLQTKDLDPTKTSCLHVKGDSMEPTIPNDATILVDTSYNDVMDGGIFVLNIDNRIFVKRTQLQPNGDLTLISDNPRYDNITITENDLIHDKVQVYGQVIHISYDLAH